VAMTAHDTFLKSGAGPATSAVEGRPGMTLTCRHFRVGPKADLGMSRPATALDPTDFVSIQGRRSFAAVSPGQVHAAWPVDRHDRQVLSFFP
jgi:hypothetical protein